MRNQPVEQLKKTFLVKTHVRSQIEWCYGAIFHAAPSKLERLDTVQSSFLRHMEINERQAYLEFNLAPLQLRLDIGMFGVLYKICIELHMRTSTSCFLTHPLTQRMDLAPAPFDAGTTCSWWIYAMERNCANSNARSLGL